MSTAGREELARRIEQAWGVLQQRIDRNARRPSDKRKDPDQIPVSLSDPAASPGRDKLKVFRPLYTVQYVVAPHSLLILAYDCHGAATDAGTLCPMIDKTQRAIGGRLKRMIADAGYCSILDLQQCQRRAVELLAPVQVNRFTESRRANRPPGQLPREQFIYQAAENCYCCPQGHRLKYVDRCRKRRCGEQTLWESRYRCLPELCGQCPLAAQCLRGRSTCRTIKRLEGQELLEAQRQKMATPEAQASYRLRSQTVELLYADSKGNRRLTRFHGRGPSRALAETGLMVVAQNLLRIDRLKRLQRTQEEMKT